MDENCFFLYVHVKQIIFFFCSFVSLFDIVLGEKNMLSVGKSTYKHSKHSLRKLRVKVIKQKPF